MKLAQSLTYLTGICFFIGLGISLTIGILALIGWIPLWLEVVYVWYEPSLSPYLQYRLNYEALELANLLLQPILYIFLGCFLVFVFGILCIQWRRAPSSHRLGLTLIGIFELFIGYSYFSYHLFFGYFGLFTGLLAIISCAASLFSKPTTPEVQKTRRAE